VHNNPLTKPSHRTNTYTPPSSTAANNNSSCQTVPCLTDLEHQLLQNNDGCFKCRRVFVSHRSAQCLNTFPKPATYKPLTQTFVDSIKLHLKKAVAAIYQPDSKVSTLTTTPAPVAVIMGISCDPVTYMPPNTSNVIEGDSDSDTVSYRTTISSVTASPTSEEIPPLTVPHLF
jgi:hypothetical protein